MQILTRDRVGMIVMFVMPIILAIVITATQNSTFELVNKNKVPLLLCNKDTGNASLQLVNSIEKLGMFQIQKIVSNETEEKLAKRIHEKEALIAVIIPPDFSNKVELNANATAIKALNNLGFQNDTLKMNQVTIQPISFLYHPILQVSFRQSVQSALFSAIQIVQSKKVLNKIYFLLNETSLPETLESNISNTNIAINEIAVSIDGTKTIPNATQHNIPAWTIFAMFFIVISLGSNIVREKLSGSFIRLKTLPSSYLITLFSKQITYLFVTLLQASVIFAIGIWLFPLMGLPKLNLPLDLMSLFVVTFICGWCAISFAMCVGVYSETQEQANGIGAVSVVLMAAIGGLLVPSFAMPESFQQIMKLSPLHWCLEAFYGLFLERGKLSDILLSIIPLLAITILFQLIVFIGLKKKNLI
ncbi:MAG: ABC transporter permease [Bacteroidetes bacterium]|nr:ABC transporter permease [Bacteroidota bacterium]